MLRLFKDRVIAYKKGDIYLGISLEFDLIVEGKTIRDALNKLYDATDGYLEMCLEDNETDSEIYRKAPKKYQNLYELFVELDAKKSKKEEDKKKEKQLMNKEMFASVSTYSTKSLCHA